MGIGSLIIQQDNTGERVNGLVTVALGFSASMPRQ